MPVTVPNASNNVPNLVVTQRAEEAYSRGQQDLLTQLNQQTNTPEDALTMLKTMAQQDPAYKELYIQLLAERENQERAYKWYEDFNNSYYQRTKADIEKAGFSPWLALQSLGASGTGSLSPAGSWSGTSGSTVSSKRMEASSAMSKQLVQSGISFIGAIIGALIIALA